MKVALVHDWLNTKRGGAEKVLEVMAEAFPDAPIYTLIHNQELFPYDRDRVHTSQLQRLPKHVKDRSRYTLPLIPSAIESWDFSDFDLVLSSSSAFTKNIITPETTHHICYCHTPARFVWDYWPQYLDEQNVGPIRRSYIRRQAKKFRLWDYAGAARVDAFLANSNTTAQRIEKFYRREAEVVHPPVEMPAKKDAVKEDYYITLGMLTPYKKIDLAIEAFNISGKKLKVIGDGPDYSRLKQLAGDNIEFVGFLSRDEKDEVVAKAKGLVFPNKEDFGIAPVEAMALGTPVIAYGYGGVTETVSHGQTGIFFQQQTPKDLNQAVDQVEETDFDVQKLRSQSEKFHTQRFVEKIKHHVALHDPSQ